jgi:peptide deformylase
MAFVRYPDPRLNQAAALQPTIGDALRATGERLRAVAREAGAHGLAAAHIGEIAPVVVVAGADAEPREYRLLYNPRIVAIADRLAKGEEGSVSLPGVQVEIERPVWVEVAYMDGEGAARQARFDGFAARVAIHEIEQMQGIFFLSRVSRLKREMALKRARKAPG